MTKLTEQEVEEITAKIESEGFEYYFTTYGPDEKLEALIGPAVQAFKDSVQGLRKALHEQGIELEY